MYEQNNQLPDNAHPLVQLMMRKRQVMMRNRQAAAELVGTLGAGPKKSVTPKNKL